MSSWPPSRPPPSTSSRAARGPHARGDPDGRRGGVPRGRKGGAGSVEDRHRAAVRGLHRPDEGGGGQALPGLPAPQAPPVAFELHAPGPDRRSRGAQPDWESRGDLRAYPRLRGRRRHDLLGDDVRRQHDARDAGVDRALRARGSPALQLEEPPVDRHHRDRLTRILDAEGLEALVATTPENLFYVSGYRSLVQPLSRGAELYG